MSKSCPVCSRKLKTENPQKGDICWETTYCAHYCRLYDEQKLEQVPFAGGNKHHNNKLTWPKITIECDMCDKEVVLKHSLEQGNRRYCSRKCYNTLKSCQKRRINKTINLLHYLEHDYKYGKYEWLPPQTIAEVCSKQSAGLTKSTVSIILKRWREAGIIEAQLQSNSNNYYYRFNPQGLKGIKVSKFIYHWNTMSYAERMAFKSK